MFNKKDFYLVSIIGFLVGTLFLMPLANLGFGLDLPLILASVLGFTIFAPIALGILHFLGRYFKVIEQFGRFAAVGTLNTLMDISVVNGLIFLTNISKGWYYTLFAVIGFLIATTNSYLWNKFWTFQSIKPVTIKEYIRFALFTLIGVLINAGTASLVVNVIGMPTGFDPKLWANVGLLFGVAASFMWNFLSYKNFVFKNTRETISNK